MVIMYYEPEKPLQITGPDGYAIPFKVNLGTGQYHEGRRWLVEPWNLNGRRVGMECLGLSLALQDDYLKGIPEVALYEESGGHCTLYVHEPLCEPMSHLSKGTLSAVLLSGNASCFRFIDSLSVETVSRLF